MRRIDRLFSEYAEHHRTRGNKICHLIGIPVILVSVFGLANLIPFGGLVALALMVVFWLTLDWRLAVLGLLAGGGLLMIGASLTWPWLVGLQLVGWVFQFVGHAIEGKRPAFLTNLPHMLVGPLWILNDIVRLVPPRSARA